jgi:hypothetical protein
MDGQEKKRAWNFVSLLLGIDIDLYANQHRLYLHFTLCEDWNFVGSCWGIASFLFNQYLAILYFNSATTINVQ